MDMTRPTPALRDPLLAACVVAALLCATAPQAAAEAITRPAPLLVHAIAEPAPPSATPRDPTSAPLHAHLRQHTGHFCTSYGCGARSGSPLWSAVGFALAAGAAVRLSRRREDAHPRP